MSIGWQDIATEEVEKRLSADSALQLIDVRNPDEYEEGLIPGSAGLDGKARTQRDQEGYT